MNLIDLYLPEHIWYWIGLTDTSNIWTWDHSKKIAKYFAWQSGEPNNTKWVKVHRVHLWASKNYTWADTDGSARKYYQICQFQN